MNNNINNPFRKTEIAENKCSIQFYAKEGATWGHMNEWLEHTYGNYGKDPHWKWRGFGEMGSADFCVVLLRRPCSECSCDCKGKNIRV